MVKCPLTMREAWVQSLGGEDPLEKEMATHSSILAWNSIVLVQVYDMVSQYFYRLYSI